MVDFRNEIRNALEAQDRPQADIVREAGLSWDKTCLTRKLTGAQPLSANDAVALADVLGVKAAAISRIVTLAREFGAEVSWPAVRSRVPGKRRAA